MEKLGRDPDHLKILPGPGRGRRNRGRGAAKRELLDSLVHPGQRYGVAGDRARAVDVSGFDLDGPLPEIPETNQSKSGRQWRDRPRQREKLTVRQLAQIAGGYGGLAMIGTPATIADQMEEWLVTDACDGFNVMFPYVPGGLDDFVDHGRSGTAAAWLVPHRIRGPHPAGKSRIAPAEEPVLS